MTISQHPALVTLDGLTIQRTEPGNLFDIHHGHLAFGGGNGVYLTLLHSTTFPNMSPSVAEIVSARHQSLWTYVSEFGQVAKELRFIARLSVAGEMPVLAFVERGKEGRVVYVRTMGEIISRHNLTDEFQIYDLKRQAAAFLGLGYVASANEESLLQEQAEAHAALVLQQQAEADSARLVAKQERVSAIMARPRLIVYGPRSVECCGTPVLALEWPSLENGTPVVVVDSYESATETSEAVIGRVSEFFRVRKLKGKNPQKANLVEYVHCTKSEAAATSVTSIKPTLSKQLGHVVVLFLNGVTTSVPQFASAADAAAHRAAGNIKMVWYAVGQDQNRTLYQIVDSEVKTVGKCDYKFTDEVVLGQVA